MKHWETICLFILASSASGQTANRVDTLIDARDGKKYRITLINGTTWMLDNLDYEAENSKGLTAEQRDKYKEFNLHGQYYHFVNVDSVCPAGWRLPASEDWSRYFEYLTTDVHPGVIMENVVEEKPTYHTAWVNFEGKLDIFEKGNPLDLYPTGRFEGNEFNRPDVYADYYTTDDKESFEGKTHIHLMNAWITIHSHKHNMQPRKEKELRRFQVRCVQQN